MISLLTTVDFSLRTRCLCGFLTALIIGVVRGRSIIGLLSSHHIRQVFRTQQQVRDLAVLHGQKLGIPTMGGLLIAISSLLSLAVWVSFNDLVIMTLIIYFTSSLLGGADDALKIIRGKSLGLTSRQKLFCQAIITALVLCIASINPPINNLLKSTNWQLTDGKLEGLIFSIAIAIFYFFVIAGTTNAVNITDGIDGLAIANVIQCLLFFTVIALCSRSVDITRKSLLTYIAGAGELAVLCSCFVGGCLAFARFNWYPASVFMGDVGAIGLGGLLAGVAILLRQPFTLILVGSIFVVETISVALQITSKRFFKRKIFLMAPLHHHFELKGYSERAIVKTSFLIQFVCVAVAFLIIFHGCI
jgi:phospho-N-acetylmuramoyl-pentapeptide-transferase